MKKGIINKLKIFIIVAFLFFISLYLYLPQNIKVIEGKSSQVDFLLPLKLKISDDVTDVNVKLDVRTNSSYNVYGKKNGTTNLRASIGFIPIKKVKVDVIPNTKIIPMGNIAGIRLYEKGVIVVGFGVFSSDGKEVSPSNGILLPGDVIIEINNQKVKNRNSVTRIINENENNEIKIKLIRDDEEKIVTIYSKIDELDQTKKIGAWIRDSTQGIGTITFYNPKTNTISLLGHAILDVDTGYKFDVRRGTIQEAEVTSIKKGTKGNPGEIMGVIYDSDTLKYGEIIKNDKNGIVALASDEIKEKAKEQKAYDIAMQNEIKLGNAYIISDALDEKKAKYEVEIEEINKYGYGMPRGMVVRVKDKELIEKTGGIVQGMSGSPIIQDGKIIGAITHVFVQDPKKGFAIFIEDMLNN